MNRGNRPIVLDIDFCRSHSPATGNGWIYADNAGGYCVPRSVIRRLSTFMEEYRNQPYAHHGPGALEAGDPMFFEVAASRFRYCGAILLTII